MRNENKSHLFKMESVIIVAFTTYLITLLYIDMTKHIFKQPDNM